MPTYRYQCDSCNKTFEVRQGIKENPLTQCPGCGGRVRRLISGGSGFILKGASDGKGVSGANGCSLEKEGRTCCGREERCGKPPCRDES